MQEKTRPPAAIAGRIDYRLAIFPDMELLTTLRPAAMGN
jgi:hypothetical protein